jgi:hypothetical protein
MREWLSVTRERAPKFRRDPSLILRAMEFVASLPSTKRATR